VMEDLEENGIPFNRDIPVGMMVEVPSAVMMIDRFVQEVDFLSIGTNDLIQYTLAVDRGNKDVAELYSASEPAVLKLIEMAVSAARARGIPICLCGQMSGMGMYTQLLLGLGLREFSVAPSSIPEIKKIIRSVNLVECEAVARQALQLENALEVTGYLTEQLKSRVPELAV
jgi:phosphotransferase system enzyme I (PtsI)